VPLQRPQRPAGRVTPPSAQNGLAVCHNPGISGVMRPTLPARVDRIAYAPRLAAELRTLAQNHDDWSWSWWCSDAAATIEALLEKTNGLL
jgi:hypothetical protein